MFHASKVKKNTTCDNLVTFPNFYLIQFCEKSIIKIIIIWILTKQVKRYKCKRNVKYKSDKTTSSCNYLIKRP